ncbi:PulJ/GspJ family protein [Desulforegula conservatrix]|uniref:PulJ/GspJ family protein n=1 Tax=Desulforegula conservatrix TaxID=153026 RepID=UPI000419BD6C|nr:prepilin-type N-terminal cleavage/methylation domain-containing protein [Desulforegula conservatrix]
MSNLKFIFKPGRLKVGHKLEDSNGFTLIELLVAIAIFSIISVGMVTIFDSLQRGYTTQQVTSDVIQKARSALSFMMEEIKYAGLDPKESGNFNVVTATDKIFTYEFDTRDETTDFNGTRDDSDVRPERKTFRFNNGILEYVDNLGLTKQANPETLVPETGPDSVFQYLNSEGLPTTNINDIRAVRVILTVRELSGRSGTVSRTLESMVLCRNLLFNSQR